MRLRIAKIDQQAIAEILGDMPVKALDDLGTGGLVGAHHLPQIFGIELAGERGRVHQVTEQHGELAAFGLRSGVVGGEPCPLRCLGMRQGRRRRGRWRRREGGCRARVASPDQTAPRIIDHMGLRVEEFVLQGSELRVIQRELELEGAIGHAAPLAQEGDHLIHDRDEVHTVSSLPCAVPVYACATPS